VREERASVKASHGGHRGHRGELEGGSGLGDAVASVREVRVSEKASHRGHRGHGGHRGGLGRGIRVG
jgi:hypothetical protein